MSANRIKADLVRYVDTSELDPERTFPSHTVPEAVVTSGLAAIAGRDTSGGAAGSIAIWLLRVGQPKKADGAGQHGRCERCARACFGDPPGRSTWIGCNLAGLFRISPIVGLKNCYTRLQKGKVIAMGN